MNYSKFDYKKACSELTVGELENLLFKSRMIGVTKIITGCWKKYKPDDIVFITLFLLYGSVVFMYFLLYSTFEYLFYSIFRKNSKKNILRYSEIKWSQNHVNNILNDNEYTTLDDVSRVSEMLEHVEEEVHPHKEDEEATFSCVPTINRARICDKKTERIEALYFLRAILKKSNILYGVVLSTEFRNVQGDELLQYNATGKLSQPYLTQIVSFGEDINYALKVLLKGKIKFHTKRNEKKSYVRIDDGDLQPFIRNLEEALVVTGIKVSLIQDN